MKRYLLFSYPIYYPNYPCGGMNDCIFKAESLEQINAYIIQYTEKQGYLDNFVEYYDCQTEKLYIADIDLLKEGIVKWELEE